MRILKSLVNPTYLTEHDARGQVHDGVDVNIEAGFIGQRGTGATSRSSHEAGKWRRGVAGHRGQGDGTTGQADC